MFHKERPSLPAVKEGIWLVENFKTLFKLEFIYTLYDIEIATSLVLSLHIAGEVHNLRKRAK